MLNLIIIACIVVVITGCDSKPKVRHYTEITIEVPDQPQTIPTIATDMGTAMTTPMPTANDVIKDKITWDVPIGWVEEPGGPMRLTTLRLATSQNAFDCSIIALPGGAGGLEANLKRWMGQINLNVADADFNRFIKSSKNQVYDFTLLQQAQPSNAKSMIAAMIDIDGTTVFVKLNASISGVKEHHSSFLSLVKSVRRK